MKIRTQLIVPILIILLSNGCHNIMEGHYYIFLKNESNIRIYAAPSGKRFDYTMDTYPDTSLPKEKPYMVEVKAGEKVSMASYSSSSSVFKSLQSDTFSVYIFNADSLDILRWKQVREKYLVLKRIDVTEEEMRAVHAIIVYH